MGHSPRPFFEDLSMKKGATFPTAVPTQIVSNEEFAPICQTDEQACVERVTRELVEKGAAQRGLTRRDFLKTTGGMAAALLAMNDAFGRFFNIGEIELFETAAFAEQQGSPYFIFDVQTHYVSSHYDPSDAESSRKGAAVQTGAAVVETSTFARRGSIRNWPVIGVQSMTCHGRIL